MAPDLKAATRHVEELPLGPDRGLVLFSCQEKGLFEARGLPVLVPNMMEIGPSAYIRPLAALVGEFQPTLLVVLDHQNARFFKSRLGTLEEIEEKAIKTEPESPEPDGNAARAGNSRLARKADELKNRHVKAVNNTLLDMAKDYDQIIIGGSKKAVDLINPFLHPYVKESLAGSFTCDAGASLSQLTEDIGEALAKAKKERQKKMLAELKEMQGPQGMVASGLNQVLAVLHEGRVQTLFVGQGFRHEGGACGGCGRLRHVAGACPLCGVEMTPVDDVVNLAVARAIESGAALEEVLDDPILESLGGIAARLRYS
jgi:peptide chain release factor subunit 1